MSRQSMRALVDPQRASGVGGGIYNEGTLTVVGCALSGNIASGSPGTDGTAGGFRSNGGAGGGGGSGGTGGDSKGGGIYNRNAPATDQRGLIRPDPASTGLPTRCDVGPWKWMQSPT